MFKINKGKNLPVSY